MAHNAYFRNGRNRKDHKSKNSLLAGFSELASEQSRLRPIDVSEKVMSQSQANVLEAQQYLDVDEATTINAPMVHDVTAGEFYDVQTEAEENICDYANSSVDESYQSSFIIEDIADVSVEIIDVFKVNNISTDKDRNRIKPRDLIRNELMVVRSAQKINRKPDFERQDFRCLDKARQNLLPGPPALAAYSEISSSASRTPLPVRVFGTKALSPVEQNEKITMEQSMDADDASDSSDDEETLLSSGDFRQQNTSLHKCPHCSDFVSPAADTLEAHVYLVHPKACRPFACEDCTMRCATSAGLAAHIRSSHMSKIIGFVKFLKKSS